MKTRVNLTIEETVLQETKKYAEEHGTSVSEIVEDYLKDILKNAHHKKRSVLDLIKELPKPHLQLDENVDYTELYYKERAKRYGF